jgi:hypothetical protein
MLLRVSKKEWFMSYRIKTFLPIVGMLLLCGYAAVAVIRTRDQAQKVKQPLPSIVGGLEAAKLVEIKDAAGQVILSGSFVAVNRPDDALEGKAKLAGAGDSAVAAQGEAEFEVSTNKRGVKQELEIEISRLAPRTSYSLHLDGKQVTTFSTDQRGAVDLEMTAAQTK